MTAEQVLKELKSLGSEKVCKVYARYGAGESTFGVSYADLGRMRKRLGVDHDLAQQLWATGYHEARLLAAMVADPGRANNALLEAWVKDLDNYVITDAFSRFVAATPLALKKMEKWTRSTGEWVGAAGWNLVVFAAGKGGEIGDDYFENCVANIERDIHRRRNRVRHAMNNALIAIGLRSPRLRKKVLAAAARIGTVKVDHGETGCKTPDAAEYIRRVVGRERKSARAA